MTGHSKKVLSFVLVILILGITPIIAPYSVATQNLEPLWIKQYYTTGGRLFIPTDLALYPDYYLMLGENFYYSYKVQPYVTVSPEGEVLSTQVLKFESTFSVATVSPLKNGNLLVGIFSKFIPHSRSRNITIGKFDPKNSQLLWLSTVNYNITTYAGHSVVTIDVPMLPTVKEYSGSIVVTAIEIVRYYDPSGYVRYPLTPILIVAKFSQTGEIQWAEYLYNPEWWYLKPQGVQMDAYGNIYLMGIAFHYSDVVEYLVKLSSKNGSIVWAKKLPVSYDVYYNTYYVAPNGTTIILRNLDRYHSFEILKVDPTGKRTNYISHIYLPSFQIRDLHVDAMTSDNNFLVSGSVFVNNGTETKLYPMLMKLKPNGTLEYVKYYNIENREGKGIKVVPDKYGNLVYMTSTIKWGVDDITIPERITILKVDPSGNIECSACQISNINFTSSEVYGSGTLSNYLMNVEKLTVLPVKSPEITIKMQSWDTLYSSPLSEETVCYVPIPMSTTNLTNKLNNLNSYLTAGITWYFLFKHYSMMFNSTYQKAKGLNVSQELLANATNLSNEAYITFQKGVSEGSFLKFPLQKIPYIRKAYILLLKAYEILKRAIEST